MPNAYLGAIRVREGDVGGVGNVGAWPLPVRQLVPPGGNITAHLGPVPFPQVLRIRCEIEFR